MANTIAILLPGTTGTLLMGTMYPYKDKIVWPDAVMAAAVLSPKEAADMLAWPSLVPGTPQGFACGNGYGAFNQYFQHNMGFKSVAATVSTVAGDLPTLQAGDNLLIGFGYDWRKEIFATSPNVTGSAVDLQQLLSAVNSKYNKPVVWLIGHSMGGLVARAFLQNAQAQKWDISNISGLITLGTPHEGAPMALEGIMGTIPMPQQNAYMDTMIMDFVNQGYSDSTYELLPPPDNQFITYQGTKYNAYTLPDDAIPTMNPTLRDAARTFWTALKAGTFPSSVKCYCIYGVSPQPTPLTFTYSGGKWTATSVAGSGDQVVPKSSAAWSKATQSWQAPCSVNHFQLPGNFLVLQQIAKTYMKVNAV